MKGWISGVSWINSKFFHALFQFRLSLGGENLEMSFRVSISFDFSHFLKANQSVTTYFLHNLTPHGLRTDLAMRRYSWNRSVFTCWPRFPGQESIHVPRWSCKHRSKECCTCGGSLAWRMEGILFRNESRFVAFPSVVFNSTNRTLPSTINRN